MGRCHRLTVPLALIALGCEPASDPVAPDSATPTFSAHQGTRTSVSPRLDGAFGPIVLATCEQGFDLMYEQEGTVTLIETTDPDGGVTRLQFVWNLVATYTNSVTGYSISGESHGPDHQTFNDDGTSRFVQKGLIVHLQTPDGAHLVDAGYIEFLIDADGSFSVVEVHGPKPVHEGFPERPILCAVVDR